MTGIVAPGFNQDLVDITPKADTSKKKKKRPPVFDTGLDGRTHAHYGGLQRTRHTPHGKPSRPITRGPSITV